MPTQWESKYLAQRYQNAVNNAQGHSFEEYIKDACALYSRQGRAEIEKTPEPFRVLEKLRDGIFKGRFTAPAQPDFQGTLDGGRSIVFEAKYTTTDRLKRDVLTGEQQDALDNFYELQQLAFLNWLMSGDVIATLPVTRRVNMPYDLRICLIEADRLSNPDGDTGDPHIVGGVETNDAGEVVAYHISKHHPLSYDLTETGWTRVEAWGAKTGRRNVLHIMNRERIGQRRGVPFLAPVIEALKQLGRYTDAELVAAVVSGMFTVFIEKESASSEGAFGEIIPEEEQVDAGDDGTIELAPGAIVDLNEGEKAHDMNPGRPNTAFEGFVIAICRQIGAALEIPYELLVKCFNSSFTASRGALLEAWKMFRMYRTWLANDFCQPIYEEWFAEAVAKGRIPAPGFFADPIIRKAYLSAEWNGPAQGLLNPVQEVEAAEKRVINGFSTRDREAMEMNGSDFYRNAAQRKREEKMLREVNEDGGQEPRTGEAGQ
ncbi:MAG: phage portal protein [Clostridiales bacterium]|nr:phage portal protein [Clostridiales bacterium]